MLLVLFSIFQAALHKEARFCFAFEENQLADSLVEVTVLDDNGISPKHTSSYLGVSFFTLEPGKYQLEYAERKQEITIFEGEEMKLSSTGPKRYIFQPKIRCRLRQEDVVWSSLQIHVEDWDGNPILGAQVLIRGRSEQGSTDENGDLSLRLPENKELDVVVFQEGFISRNIQGHMVSDQVLKVRMSPAGYEIPELSIVAPRIEGSASTMLARRKEPQM